MTFPASSTTVHGVLVEAARTAPEKTAITFVDGLSYSRGELLDLTLRVARGFSEAGVRPGDRVALIVGNRIEFVLAFFALSMIGAVSVPINTALKGGVLTHMLSTVGPCRLIIDDECSEAVAPAIRDSGAVTSVWRVPRSGESSTEPSAFAELIADDPLEALAGSDGSTLQSILCTSGTTGRSKGVMWSHTMALGTCDNATWVMGYRPDDIVYTCLPLFHINALYAGFIAALRSGATTVVSPRFSVRRFWSEITEHRATTTNMLGAMGALLWKNTPDPLEHSHRLRLAMVVPFPRTTYAEFEERFGLQLTELYGSTDTGVPLGIPFGTRRPGSCGTVAPGWEVAIVDAMDNRVEAGSPGEIVTRPLVPFIGQLGYWGQAEMTWAAHRNCWFHTGDRAVADEDGYFRFLDRSDDALRVSGENVSSFEVEQVLVSHTAVAEAAVVAVPSDLGDDDLVAFIVAESTAKVSPKDIEDFAFGELPYFAVPRYLSIIDRLPKTSTQKVKKGELRTQGVPCGAYDGGQRRRRARP